MSEQKYSGDTAKIYDVKRELQPKWQGENDIVERMLRGLPAGLRVLDIPVGTGRFIPLYERMGFSVLGLDISKDMLTQAEKKVTGAAVELREGDILNIDLPDHVCDISVCVRLFRWISPEEVQTALRELQRVTRKTIIFNARIANHPYARPMSLIKGSLLPHWKIEQEIEIEPDYIMFMLRGKPDEM